MTRSTPVLFAILALACDPATTDDTDPGGTSGDLVATAGECEGSPYEKSLTDDTAGSETVIWAEADGATIVLHLDDLVANCCPSPGADLARDGFALTVDFHDVTDGTPCDCVCVTDFRVEIPDNEPGSYTLDVLFNGSALGAATVDVI